MSLTADPPACTVPAAGGSSTRKLVNGGADKLIFKIKLSNKNECRITPVFGFVDPFGSKEITITRWSAQGGQACHSFRQCSS
uniref:MSP domain-containing protein n=1 Tax=Caenorhabditis japonica TaxID=281687 RepID=A0A8R1E2G3_CAEJA